MIAVHAILQTATVVNDRNSGVARIADLFAAVPADRGFDAEKARTHGTIFAFENHTFLELLDPVGPGHTRHRFLERNGPGAYMLSVVLENEDEAAVGTAFAERGVEAVVEGPFGTNHRYRWHLHPRHVGMLMLETIMNDRDDNSEWAGDRYRDDVPGNTRFVRQVRGLIARTADPTTESAAFADIGYAMTERDGGWRWSGATGTVLELWPEDAWSGVPLAGRRDYAIVIEATDRDALIRRLANWGFAFEADRAGGRLISSIDPVLGVRFAIDGR